MALTTLQAIILGALTVGATVAYARSPEVAAEFQRQHPCPSTGLGYGRCPGWIKDHVVPLACGGPDDPTNMQWQTVADAKVKDRWELAYYCGKRRGGW